MHPTDPPLCVDLDGTLLRSDLLLESLLVLIKQKPWCLFLLPRWLSRGRAFLKQRIAERVTLNPESLPLNSELLHWLSEERERGRSVKLVTASDRSLAQPLADRAGVFDECIASDGVVNLKAGKKRDELVRRFGDKCFDYVGNSPADFVVWDHAREVVVVSERPGFVRAVTARYPTARVFPSESRTLITYLKAIRVHQWVKNLLIFVPVTMAHELGDTVRLLSSAAAFLSFSLCASGVYVVNDLLDLESDRLHRSKRKRPFASGRLPLSDGLILAPILLVIAFGTALWLSSAFFGVLCAYFVTTLAYSLRLKQISLVDIMVLAGLYTVRVLAGGVATEVQVSPWLLAFSMFFFFSLASIKRFSELYSLRQKDRSAKAAGRGYLAVDLELLAMLGIAAGFTSVLVLALYVTGPDVMKLYSHPSVLLLIGPLLMYWLSRVWLLAHRGLLHEDPIVFAITDRVSYCIGAATALILFFAV
jgi:4-hydroxybenzoate polyprenyltransferase